MYISISEHGLRPCCEIVLQCGNDQLLYCAFSLRRPDPQPAMKVGRYQAVELLGIYRRRLLQEGRITPVLTSLGSTVQGH